MKKIILLLFIVAAGIKVNAQKKAIDKAVDSTCKCLEANKDAIKTPKDFDKFGEECIVRGSFPHFEQIAKEENIKYTDEDDLNEKIGEKIGMKLALNCSLFMEMIMKFDSDDEDMDGEELLVGKLSGTVTNVETGTNIYLHIKDENGKVTKLVWLEYFPGSDDYKTTPASLKGKKISTSWKQVELYSIKEKDFVTTKKITKLAVE